MSYDLWTEPWGQDIHSHGDGSDVLYDVGYSKIEVRAGGDVRGLGVVGGYGAESLGDDATGWC